MSTTLGGSVGGWNSVRGGADPPAMVALSLAACGCVCVYRTGPDLRLVVVVSIPSGLSSYGASGAVCSSIQTRVYRCSEALGRLGLIFFIMKWLFLDMMF